MVDGLFGLFHDAVIGRHYQDHEIGDLGPAGAHGGKGLMAGGIDKRDGFILQMCLIGADMLRNASELAFGHIFRADGVQERGLAVVDMSHDCHHGRSGAHVFRIILGFIEVVFPDLVAGLLDLEAQLAGGQDGFLGVEVLVFARA